ncbi:glycosyltransferase family 4 protein [Coleofasciculus sp. G2-EDA-02]|uniref:glycosyltransferase family 4 protein n=1 Tax=Coleofasciculus sp. G2-EDA-02 TaxID=3069529 RepID=UPI0032F70745
MLSLAYFVSHPIQYQAPLLRLIAADPDIDLKVFFYSNFSLTSYQDRGFGLRVEWDVPLTAGYDHQFLNCWGSKQWKSILQQPIATDITKQLKQGQFDAIWVHGWMWIGSLQAILDANKLGIPVLIRGEANGLQEPMPPLKQLAKKAFLNWVFEKVQGFLYVGKLNYQFYKSYRISDEKLFSMPYTVDNDYFQKRAMQAQIHREELRQSLSLQPGRLIILYAAKLIPVKRPQDLLAAYRLLSPDGVREPDPYLLFVGDGALRAQLEAEAKVTGWNSIRFLGFRNQSQMPSIYDLSDVFVLPSSFEPWGLAVNEVMNAGKAVVVSNRVGSAADLVVDGQNGKSFPVEDVDALAEAIRWAIANYKVAGEMSFKFIRYWSFKDNLQGLKQALNYCTILDI